MQVRKIVSSLANPARDLLVSPLLVHGAHCRDIIAVGRVDKQRDGAIRTGWAQRTVVLTRTALMCVVVVVVFVVFVAVVVCGVRVVCVCGVCACVVCARVCV